MGVNALVCLSRDVQLRDVSKAVGILSGLEQNWVGIGRDLECLDVKGAQAIPTSIPEMAEIILKGEMVDGENQHRTSYHFENDNPNYILMYPKSTAFWIAIGIELCKFFGGKIQFKDSAGGLE